MILGLIAACYLIGSIPVAWIVTRLVTGEDLRRMGTGNVGVMNVAISVARWAGVLVFLAEAAKAALAITLARSWIGGDAAVGIAVLATFAGTRWPIWLRGAGGRGNTVAATSLLIISWPSAAAIGALWLLIRLLTGSSFLATRVNFVAGPLIVGALTRSWWYVLMGAVFSLLFMTAHRRETDDHLVIKRRWSGLRSFLTMPPRRK
jgi:glycerol-3-phosphate acyltransferase PlsY